MKNRARILPRDRAAAPLDIVIAVMALLATLALGASFIAGRAAEGWRAGLSDRVTIQVLPPEPTDAADQPTLLAREVEAALAVLRETPGIETARPLSSAETAQLVQPWLGADVLVSELPLPRLIDATLTPGASPDLAALASRLKSAAPHALLDDHSRWTGRLESLSSTLIFSAWGILALIAIATAATVAFATRAGLDAHHEMVSLLHQMGARAGFIAGAFERHYSLSALGAGAAGALAAALLFVAARGLEGLNEAVPFLPPLSLTLHELAWLAAVPAGAALIALVTARLSVLSVLRRIY